MKKLVIDIETVGTPWEDLDSYVREYLIKGLSDGDAEETRRAGGLSPFRGKIVAIGVLNIYDGRSCGMYEVTGQQEVRTQRTGVRATAELYEKVAPTLLMFNRDFKDAEERAAVRLQQLPLTKPVATPPDEPTFIEQVTQTSLTLTTVLDQPPPARGEELVTSKHP